MLDFGYDISDFRAIDETFGTMEDFRNIVKRCKELYIKIILDFVPNHTSDEHDLGRPASFLLLAKYPDERFTRNFRCYGSGL